MPGSDNDIGVKVRNIADRFGERIPYMGHGNIASHKICKIRANLCIVNSSISVIDFEYVRDMRTLAPEADIPGMDK